MTSAPTTSLSKLHDRIIFVLSLIGFTFGAVVLLMLLWGKPH